MRPLRLVLGFILIGSITGLIYVNKELFTITKERITDEQFPYIARSENDAFIAFDEFLFFPSKTTAKQPAIFRAIKHPSRPIIAFTGLSDGRHQIVLSDLNGKPIWSDGGYFSIPEFKFSNTGKFLAFVNSVAGGGQCLIIIDIDTFAHIDAPCTHPRIHNVVFSPDDEIVSMHAEDMPGQNFILIQDIKNNVLLKKGDAFAKINSPSVFSGQYIEYDVQDGDKSLKIREDTVFLRQKSQYKLYESQEYKISFEYPSDWIVNNQIYRQPFLSLSTPERAKEVSDLISKKINVDGPQETVSVEFCEDINAYCGPASSSYWGKRQFTDLEDFLSDPNTPSKIVKKIEAKDLKIFAVNKDTMGFGLFAIMIEHNRSIYIFTFPEYSQGNVPPDALYTSIISSIKFTN